METPEPGQVTAIQKFFFTPLYRAHTTSDVVMWWESRRALYNAAVGAAGTLSLIALALAQHMPAELMLYGTLLYGFMANVGYTLGPIADVVLRRALGERADVIGPVLFRYGFIFSIGLTLLPIPLVVMARFAEMLFGR
jgi:hypothetical protein